MVAKQQILLSVVGEILTGRRTPADVAGVSEGVLNGMYSVGVHAHRRGELEVADDLFQRCVRMDPKKYEFWVALAATRQARGSAEEAGEIYQVASTLTADYAPVAYAAACFAEAGLLERAAVLADYVREKAPDPESLTPWLDTVDQAVLQGVV